VKLSDAVEGYLLLKSTRASPTTIKLERHLFRQLKEQIGNPEVGDITSEDIREYLAYHQGRGLAPHTVKRHYAAISSLYTWLCSDEIGLAETNPIKAVQAPKLPKLKPKALTQEQIALLLEAAEERATEKRRAKALILFLIDTGARASEVCGVKIPDVGFESGRVKVRGKGSKDRYVYLGRRALSALWLYVKDERPEPARVGDNHLFLTFDGYPMNRETLRRFMGRLGKWANVHASPHMFRHTAAISHLRHGMDLVSLQHLLGHESLEITQVYLTALSDEDVERQAKRTSPADNWRL
jgi:site-specific recombinase XerD